MAIFGLALGLTGGLAGQTAEAARGDRGPVARPNATRATASSLGGRSAARPAATRAQAPVATARGGHVLRTPAASTARASARDRGAVASRGPAGRQAGTAARHAGAMERGLTGRQASMAARHAGATERGLVGRHGSRQQHASLARAGFHRGGFHSAMLRGSSSRFASMSACSTVRGRRVCGGSRTVAMRWSGGLPPAAGNQSSCPDGTMATLAVGHENVVRCVPM